MWTCRIVPAPAASRPAATHTLWPMKFMKLVPCSTRLAIHALLSPAAETWQSVQRLVSVERTVCGTNVLNACPLNPSAEMVCSWV